jgi:hypothetical protein
MPFVQRDSRGVVMAIFRERTGEAVEYLAPNDEEVISFLPTLEDLPDDPLAQRKQELTETDFALIRAIEDLVQALLDKNVLGEADLPPQMLYLIEKRKSLRRLVQELQKAGLTGL